MMKPDSILIIEINPFLTTPSPNSLSKILDRVRLAQSVACPPLTR